MINIPPYYKHTLTVLEEGRSFLRLQRAVLSDACHGTAEGREKIRTPENLKDWGYVEKILRENNCWVTGIRKITV